MGKLQEFDIILTDNKVVYSPGESITGTLKITTAEPLLCKAIKVNCNGFCGVTSKINDTAWTVEEPYFNSTVIVTDKGTLKEGEHSFPFKFFIPASAPTSFEGNYGKIIYRVRAFIDTPRFAKDYKTEKPFYLLSLLNLNEVPDIQEPSSSAITKKFSYMLMKTGTVSLKAQTDMRGYTPGQVIQLTAEVQNQSGRTTSTVVASLMQRVTYQTKSKPTYDQKTIAEVEGAGVKAGKLSEWKEQIIVPPLPQSSLSGCNLITMEYYIQVTLKSADATVTLPIHVGNVSLDKKSKTSIKAAPPSRLDSSPAARPISIADPTSPPTPAPRAATRKRGSSCASPSAPPADEHHDGPGAIPTKNSQLGPSVPQASMSPCAFSYAPGVTFPQNPSQHGSTGATGASAPYFSEGTPMPIAFPPLLHPDYGNSVYPLGRSASHFQLYPTLPEAPPSYDQSCSGST
ncbi:arrestin domain-containing protein 1a isoform X1 [Osmerus eperlanus]|uniref:arrestin domain-containing protein 1a isoform X1 n=1 Tax=Osmerus eperlanus TaxID=29151 RepID=UPI002E100D9D